MVYVALPACTCDGEQIVKIGSGCVLRIDWNRVVWITSVAAFFAALALDLTVPVVALSVLALVDRTLVSLFMGSSGDLIPEGIEEQAA